MSVLLKIIEGPNAGAEVVLPDGVRIALGRSDDCDIILADDTLPAKACEIVASSSAVELFNYDGTDESLKFYHVKYLSAKSAIAAGPETGAWEDLVYPANENEEPVPVKEPNPPPPSPPPSRTKMSRTLRIVSVIMTLCAATALFFGMKFTDEAAGEPVAEVRPDPMEALAEVAERYNLTVREADGGVVLSGTLSTLKERTEASAQAYRVMKCVKLEIGDDESISRGAAEILHLVGAAGLSVEGSKSGRVSLKGSVAGKEGLIRALEAIRAEVPYLKDVVCSNVTVACDMSDRVSSKAECRYPQIAVAGIIERPHPCIILRDGTRLAEGAEIGGFLIEKISAESVLVRSAEGVIKWQP